MDEPDKKEVAQFAAALWFALVAAAKRASNPDNFDVLCATLQQQARDEIMPRVEELLK